MLNTEPKDFIRVKFMARPEKRIWRRQLPDSAPTWGACEFIFDPDERNYDWLVVYDDLPPADGERRSMRIEQLACPREQTILVTSEPSSIKSYFTDFTDQFGIVLTSQPAWALPHKRRIFQQPALQWFYGLGSHSTISVDELAKSTPIAKSDLIATVGSSKQQKHTLHKARYDFIKKVRQEIPQLKVFGREDIGMDDKAESIAPFRYHLAIENHISRHHWTEKLADVFLGESVPLYIGCPNAKDYFPEESFITLDINKPSEAIAIIKNLSEDDYLERLPHVLEAKRRIINDYNLFSVLNNIISSSLAGGESSGGLISSRRQTIRRNGITIYRHIRQKIKNLIIQKFLC